MGLSKQLALVLTGGGARGAYQAGVLRGIYEICREIKDFSLFQNLSGASAGAINATAIAGEIDQLDTATERLCHMWSGLQAEQVFQTNYSSITKNVFGLLRGGQGLLNTVPLHNLLTQHVRFENLNKHIESKALRSLCVTATDYASSLGVSFYMGPEEIVPWRGLQRLGMRSQIQAEHVMASSAIPLFFPPWPIGTRDFGDGCLRNTAPLSPAVHVGAEKILVIGVRRRKIENLEDTPPMRASLGRVLGVLTNAIFMDAIEVDLDRMRIINEIVDGTKSSSILHRFRKVDTFYIHPSRSLSDIALAHEPHLPRMIRLLMSGMGNPAECAELLSYLLFSPEYCSELVELGLQDAHQHREVLLQWLEK